MSWQNIHVIHVFEGAGQGSRDSLHLLKNRAGALRSHFCSRTTILSLYAGCRCTGAWEAFAFLVANHDPLSASGCRCAGGEALLSANDNSLGVRAAR